jgi:glutamyl endopeptidase
MPDPARRTVVAGVRHADANRVTDAFEGLIGPPPTASRNPGLVGMFDPVPVSGSPVKSLVEAGSGAPGQPVPQSTTLVGPDDRQLVVNPLEYPYAPICALRIQGDRSAQIMAGTGVMVSPRLVLTAGHNLFNNAIGGNATQVRVYAGLNGNYQTVRSVLGARFVSVTEWSTHALPSYDYGAIVLPTDLGTQLGYYAVQGFATNELVSFTVNNLGYPIDCPRVLQGNCPQFPGTLMFLNVGRIISTTDFTFTHTIDTAGGSSGSPIILVAATQPTYRVVGIHTYGIDGGMGNVATRINVLAHDTIQFWIDQAERGLL